MYQTKNKQTKTKVWKEKPPNVKCGYPWGGKTVRTFMYFYVLFKFPFNINIVLLTFFEIKIINPIKIEALKVVIKYSNIL